MSRPETFVNSVSESSRQGLISSNNAAKMILAHVGKNIDDRRDAIVMSARWPGVAESFHSNWKLWGPIPQIRCSDPNLKADIWTADETFTRISS